MRMASILFIIIVSCFTPAFADDADLKKQGEQLSATYVEHWNKHDAVGLAALWSPNAIYINAMKGPTPPSAAEYEGLFKAGLDHLESSVTQVVPLGPDAAVSTGTYHFTGKSPSGAAIDTSGFFTSAFAKEGGTWKIKMIMGAPKPTTAK